MRCPRCGHEEDRVIDSRAVRDGKGVRRRRECLKCGHRFTTYEYVDALNLAQQFLSESKRIATAWAELNDATSRTDINRRAAKTLVRIIISALYDAMKLNITADNGIINFDQKEQIKKLTERFDPEQSAEKIVDAYKILQWIDASVNEKLIFEQLLLNLAVSDKIQV